MQRIKIFSRVTFLFMVFNFFILSQAHADIVQPYSNTFLSLDYYELGQSFTAEDVGYTNIFAWVDPSSGSGDVGMTLKLNDSILASGTSGVAADGMVSLNVSGASFTNGVSYDLFLNGARFAKVYWQGSSTMGDVYTGGELITKFDYVQDGLVQRQLSEYDLAFTVYTNPVPIPGAILLLGSGLLGLAGVRRRKK